MLEWNVDASTKDKNSLPVKELIKGRIFLDIRFKKFIQINGVSVNKGGDGFSRLWIVIDSTLLLFIIQ
jgi:hypothetical protein